MGEYHLVFLGELGRPSKEPAYLHDSTPLRELYQYHVKSKEGCIIVE